MAGKETFTPQEWTEILESVLLAGIAVSAADPSGLWGTLKEAFAGSSAMRAAKGDSNELVKSALADFEDAHARSEVQHALQKRFADATPAQCVERSLASLSHVSAILDKKAPADAEGFKAWLCRVSGKVAEASREGTFLFMGGERVSDAEKATLADIARSLGRPA